MKYLGWFTQTVANYTNRGAKAAEDFNETKISSRDSEDRITGEIVSWLYRTESGGINMGWTYPEGRFQIVKHPNVSQMRERLGESITARPVGWFSVDYSESVSFSVPDKPGTYAIIER